MTMEERFRHQEDAASSDLYEEEFVEEPESDKHWHTKPEIVGGSIDEDIWGAEGIPSPLWDSSAKTGMSGDTPNKPEQKPKRKNSLNLQEMATEITEKVPMILHDGDLYYYTGAYYQIINNDEELLKLIRTKVSNDAFGCQRLWQFQDLLKFLKADSSLIPPNYEDKIRESQFLISFRNGVLDVRTLELMPHDRSNFVFYRIDTKWKKSNPPEKFLEVLRDISDGDESIEVRILESLGYLMTPVNKGKCFFIMGTAPDSGKSTLANMLEAFVGDEKIKHTSTYQMDGKFALGDIRGKTLNITMDLPRGKFTPVTVSIVKQITGGDAITIEQKYVNTQTAHSNMRFLFGSNYPIDIAKGNDDDAFWNRMIIIPFLKSVDKDKKDDKMGEKLQREKKGIIYLCITAFKKVFDRGYIFTECKAADEMKQQWRKQEPDGANVLQRFVNNYLEVTESENDSVYLQDLYAKYVSYCHEYNCVAIMEYNRFITWLNDTLPTCRKKRIHHTGENARSGITGIRWR